MKFSKILVAASGRCSKLIREVTAIAVRDNSNIELCNVVRPLGIPHGLSEDDRLQNTRALVQAQYVRLGKIAESLRKQGIETTCHVETNDSITEGILQRVRQSKPDLCAIEAHKHNTFSRLLLTQTDFNLIRYCPVPLLIVKGGAGKQRSTVLAALDPWHANGKPASLDGDIVRAARGLSKTLGVPLHSAHVYAPLVGFISDGAFAPVAIPVSLPEERKYSAKVRRAFHSINSKYKIANRNAHLKMGDPAFALPEIARRAKARVVVMGAVSRKIMKRVLIGNTAEKVLDAMPCDILIVKPSDFQVAA